MSDKRAERKWQDEGLWRVFDGVITPRMCRGARGVLSWGTADLANAAGLARSTVVRFEGGRETMMSNVIAIKAAFIRHGILFGIDKDGHGLVVFELDAT